MKNVTVLMSGLNLYAVTMMYNTTHRAMQAASTVPMRMVSL